MTPRRANAFAYSRAGLLGNPSDGYGGKAIAVSLSNFRAEVTLEAADEIRFEPGVSDLQRFASVRDAVDEIAAQGCDDGLRLLRAALARFAAFAPSMLDPGDADPRARFAMRYETSIPRQVGLAGSSAIVVSALRALARWFDVEISPAEIAELALAAELDLLGIAAGPMDRVIQAYDGLVVMDLREPRSAASYASLDVALLPPMFIAWDPRLGTSSGRSHAGLRSSWLAGDPEVLRVVEQLRRLVDEGVECLERRDHDALRSSMNRNFDLRAKIFPVAARDRQMVGIARTREGGAKQCGSGGAVIGMPARGDRFSDLEAAYRAAGFAFAPAQFQEAPA